MCAFPTSPFTMRDSSSPFAFTRRALNLFIQREFSADIGFFPQCIHLYIYIAFLALQHRKKIFSRRIFPVSSCLHVISSCLHLFSRYPHLTPNFFHFTSSFLHNLHAMFKQTHKKFIKRKNTSEFQNFFGIFTKFSHFGG